MSNLPASLLACQAEEWGLSDEELCNKGFIPITGIFPEPLKSLEDWTTSCHLVQEKTPQGTFRRYCRDTVQLFGFLDPNRGPQGWDWLRENCTPEEYKTLRVGNPQDYVLCHKRTWDSLRRHYGKDIGQGENQYSLRILSKTVPVEELQEALFLTSLSLPRIREYIVDGPFPEDL